MRASNGTHTIIPQHRLDEHARLAGNHSRLTGATLTLLRSAENYGGDDERHQLAIAEVREALGLTLVDLIPLLAASIEHESKRPVDVVHTCSCGQSFTRAQWAELLFVGEQLGGDESLELRQCPCGSTRAVVAVAP